MGIKYSLPSVMSPPLAPLHLYIKFLYYIFILLCITYLWCTCIYVNKCILCICLLSFCFASRILKSIFITCPMILKSQFITDWSPSNSSSNVVPFFSFFYQSSHSRPFLLLFLTHCPLLRGLLPSLLEIIASFFVPHPCHSTSICFIAFVALITPCKNCFFCLL